MFKWFKKKEDKQIDIANEEVSKFTEEINNMYKELIRLNDERAKKIIDKLDEMIKICDDILVK